MVTDSIADMIARIQNAARAMMESVDIPASKMKLSVADILLKEGYIKAYKVVEDAKQGILRINLKYHDGGHVISGMERVSKPGRRIYNGAQDLPIVRDGLGISILSTSQGIMTNSKARELGIGGEVLIRIW
jgi:small subunit ribosomal protein S8